MNGTRPAGRTIPPGATQPPKSSKPPKPSGAAARIQENLHEQIIDARKSTAITEIATLRSIHYRKYLKRQRILKLIFFILIVLVGVFFVYWSVSKLQHDYVSAYTWWNSPQGYQDFTTTPYPDGIYLPLTVPGAAMAAEYPQAAFAEGLLFRATPPPRNGAVFLLRMVGLYGFSKKLKAIHWHGSSAQLRFADLKSFLPEGPIAQFGTGTGYNWAFIYASWTQLAADGQSYANPWADTLFQDLDSFQNSIVINEYYAGKIKARQLIEALFRGGLCAVAMTYFESDTSVDGTIEYIFGTVTTQAQRPCSAAQKAAAAIQLGSAGFGVGAALAMAFVPEFSLAGMLGVLVGGAIPAAGGVVLSQTVMKPQCGVETVPTEDPAEDATS